MKIISVSMDIIDESKAIIQPVESLSETVKTDMLRLDLIHPEISGNKWYKLKYNLQYAAAQGYKAVLTFGGAYSNHLVATAAAAQIFNLQSYGIVRGHFAKQALTNSLHMCRHSDMQLHFISRDDYRRKNDRDFLHELSEKFPSAFIIPEGGANELGREGIKDLARFMPQHYDVVCTAVGTGTTFAGLRNALPEKQKLLGFVPMKNGHYLKQEIEKHLRPEKNIHWQLFDDWHFGGFGKYHETLLAFMNSFHAQNTVPLDIVYTGKMMYGVQQLISSGHFDKETKILCIHSGGLQGNTSAANRLIYS